MNNGHKGLECGATLRDGRSCTGILGVFWGYRKKTRLLATGEHARPNHDALKCHNRRCQARWEVESPIQNAGRAA